MSLGSVAITAERSTAEILLLTGMRLGSAAITAERKFADSSPYLGKTLKNRQTECSSSASEENTLCKQVEFQHVRYLPYMHTGGRGPPRTHNRHTFIFQAQAQSFWKMKV